MGHFVWYNIPYASAMKNDILPIYCRKKKPNPIITNRTFQPLFPLPSSHSLVSISSLLPLLLSHLQQQTLFLQVFITSTWVWIVSERPHSVEHSDGSTGVSGGEIRKFPYPLQWLRFSHILKCSDRNLSPSTLPTNPSSLDPPQCYLQRPPLPSPSLLYPWRNCLSLPAPLPLLKREAIWRTWNNLYS